MPAPALDAPVFISESREVLTGAAAVGRLQGKNDAHRVDPRVGILRVDRERWLEAQRYERTTWMRDFTTLNDDRNLLHAGHFDGYNALKAMEFSSAIELGCGPFTNMRLIAPLCSVGELHLLDPLIESYLQHPNCSYAHGALRTVSGASIPVHTHATGIEEFAAPRSYDLVVMINVLEHCFDAQAIFRNVLTMLSPRGIFVFHDRYYDSSSLPAQLLAEYDAGHPLRIDRAVIDEFLSRHFEMLHHRVVRFPRHKWGGDRSYDGVYAIGRLQPDVNPA